MPSLSLKRTLWTDKEGSPRAVVRFGGGIKGTRALPLAGMIVGLAVRHGRSTLRMARPPPALTLAVASLGLVAFALCFATGRPDTPEQARRAPRKTPPKSISAISDQTAPRKVMLRSQPPRAPKTAPSAVTTTIVRRMVTGVTFWTVGRPGPIRHEIAQPTVDSTSPMIAPASAAHTSEPALRPNPTAE